MNSYQGAWGEDRALKPSERLAAFEAWDTLFGFQNHLAESVIKNRQFSGVHAKLHCLNDCRQTVNSVSQTHW